MEGLRLSPRTQSSEMKNDVPNLQISSTCTVAAAIVFGVCFHLMDAKVPVGCKTCHAGFEFGIIVVLMYERARRQQKYR